MRLSRPSALLAIAAVLGLSLSVLVFFSSDEGTAGRQASSIEAGDIAWAPPPLAEEVHADLVPPPRVEMATATWDEPSSVLWPCRVELDLIQADYLPSDPAVVPIGSGRSARLSGRIAGALDRGVRAEVHFVAGPNQGRVLSCDASGAFGAIDLYPGLDIVEVRGPGIGGARREVRLRQNGEAQLNLGFGILGSVAGKVVDRRGNPLSGARVQLDGQTTITSAEGGFFLSGLAGGPAVAEVDLKGFATLMQIVGISAGRGSAGAEVVMTLQEATSMVLSTPTPVGGPGPTYAFVLPANTAKLQIHDGAPVLPSRYPWHRINPIVVHPGSSTVVEDLPPEVVRVLAFRAGALALEQVVNLRPDRVNPVVIELQPAPLVTGVVSLDGAPVAGALVTLEAPDRVRANLGFLKRPSSFLEAEVLPYLPVALQSARTDVEGRYVFSAWDEAAGVRYLEARGPSGTWAGELVPAGAERVDLELKPVELGDSMLAVEFPGRHQGLPLEVVVNGAPQDPYLLGPLSDLVIEDLPSGRWRLKITWNGAPVLALAEFRLSEEARFAAALPLGAVEGQDAEAWQRAGRDWPF